MNGRSGRFRRLPTTRRRSRDGTARVRRGIDRGISALEYAAIIGVAAAVVAGVIMVAIPDTVGPRTESAICALFRIGCEPEDGGGDGGQNAGGQNGTPQGGGGTETPEPRPSPRDDDRDDDDDDDDGGGCEGNIFQQGLCHLGNGAEAFGEGIVDVGEGIVDVGKGIGLGLWDTGVGLWEGVTFTACLVHICSHEGFKSNWGGIITLFTTSPTETLPVIWDSMTEQCHEWSAEQVARCVTGFVGSIVGGKGINKLSKLGKLDDVPTGGTSRLDELADSARRSADDAEDLAGQGKLDEAQRAADDADRVADEAELEASRAGCPVSLGPPGGSGGGPGAPVRAGAGGRAFTAGGFLALLRAPALRMCPAGDNAKQARREALRAAKAVQKQRLLDLGLSDAEADALLASIKDQNSIEALRKSLDAAADPAKAVHIKKTLQDMAAISNSLTPQSVQGVLARLNSASARRVDDPSRPLPALGAEVAQARRVLDSGQVKPGTKIAIGAKGATDFGGGHRVTFPQGVDADVAFVDEAGVVHLNEVKESMNALITSLQEGKQLPKYQSWQSSGGGQATFVVNSADNANDLFKPQFAGQLQELIDSGITVRIGDQDYDSAALRAARDRGHF